MQLVAGQARTSGWTASLGTGVGPSAKPQKRTRLMPEAAASWNARRGMHQSGIKGLPI